MRQVIMYSGADGYYVVDCPSLPGCMSLSFRLRDSDISYIVQTLPYMIDVVDYDHLENQDLKAHIDRVGQIIYESE